MTSLLEQKYDKMFSLLDASGNGVIAHDDFETMADAMLTAFGVPREETKGIEFAAEMTNFWNSLRGAVDVNFDGQVTKEEFLTAASHASDNFSTLVEPLYRAVFRLADSDGDGAISKDEFVKGEIVVGVSAEEGAATFDRLAGADGKLSVDDMISAVRHFYQDEDGTDSETHLFYGSL